MEGSVLEVHEPQELLMQVPQRDLVRQASQSPPQTHLADEERPHGTRHYGSVEPEVLIAPAPWVPETLLQNVNPFKATRMHLPNDVSQSAHSDLDYARASERAVSA